jgi:hypothetical protein
MALTKVTTKGITDDAVTTSKVANSNVTTAKIATSAVESSEINDGTVTASDLASTLDLSSKTVTLPGSATAKVDQNIALLGFKMAVNDGLTIFNLVDGVVDEFHDESGTDEAEGSNDQYCATNDLYQNLSVTPATFSAGFTTSSITEPDTSTVQSNTGSEPSAPQSTNASFTVPCGMTSANIKLFGAGASSGSASGNPGIGYGGGGGFSEGTLAVTAGQVLDVYVGEGGIQSASPGSEGEAYLGGGARGPDGGNGGGGTFVTAAEVDLRPAASPLAPQIALAAGAGGGGGGGYGSAGGGGGGLTGCAGESQSEQTSDSPSIIGGGGDQEQGGSGGSTPSAGQSGSFLQGGNGGNAGGGGGYYGGGGGGGGGNNHGGAGGGGSSYYGHPQITSGSTEEAEGPLSGGDANESGSKAVDPDYNETAEYGEGKGPGSHGAGFDGFVLITGSGCASAPGGTTTLVSNAFTANSVPTTSRIVVFQENVDTPTLNTDIIASISRDGGSNFTTATLSDSGYVTGSSGQRILTGTATITGQPSGQSMRWKLALANNTSKIHGVALQWS